MNAQAHVSGQLSSQAANQTGIQMPVLPQQNGVPSSSQMQNIGRQTEVTRVRGLMLRKIYEIILRRHQPTHEVQAKKLKDIVRRLEEGLFRSASSQEEYMNFDTLESRLQVMIKRQSSHNSRFAQQKSVSSVGTMIPTPGFSNGGNSNMAAIRQGDTSMMSTNGNISITSSITKARSPPSAETMVSGAMQNGSFASSDGFKSEGYKGRSTMISDMGVQNVPSRMMPTPGFTSCGNHPSVKMESTNASHGTTSVDTAMLSQQQLQKKHVGSQKSHMLLTPGSHVGKQPKQHGYSNGSMGGGSLNGHLIDVSHGSLSKSSQQHTYHTQQSLPHGTHDSKSNSLTDQSGLHDAQQNEDARPQPIDRLEKIDLQVLPQDESHPSHEQYVQELSHRVARQDDAQRNDFSSDLSVVSQTLMSGKTEELFPPVGAPCSSVNASRERSFVNQKKWILFLKHAQHCTAPEGRCRDTNCPTAQKLLKHVDQCRVVNCPYPRCHKTKILLSHYKTCKDQGCPVCVPVKSFLSNHRKLVKLSRLPKPEDSSAVLSPKDMSMDTSDNFPPPLKRLKIEQLSRTEFGPGESTLSMIPSSDGNDRGDACRPNKCESVDTNKEHHSNSGQDNPMMNETAKDDRDILCNQRQITQPVSSNETSKYVNQDTIKAEKEIAQPKQEMIASPMEGVTKSIKPKIKGVSLIELFTPEQVLQHFMGLKQWVGQSKAKAEKNQAMEHLISENSCQLCAVERLTFDPPPIYCTPCGARIKRNAAYYSFGMGDTRNFFCVLCYNEARGDSIAVDGNIVRKSRLEKKKNDEEAEEWWVQCDKCELWQHQICALFNGKRNDGGQAEYTCPQCYLEEIERGQRKPLPQSAVLGAKDLPRTILSDHIEEQLNKRLKWERQERARVQGKGYDEVPGAESLVVRVVSSVDKKLEVKQRFLEIFQEENYPREFPYKSKVVLLFQKIEGVEVCLFGMYVQEFGAECQHPNHRRVYLSYLDSVKYFRPETKAVTGEALRTFVYHEILIGYLDYCKKRGFTSCYIWACPPLKGEDYILYCHPEIQKTPKSDKLREWYISMLQKASKESIVVGLTNLYDHFFTSTGECKAKVTAARLPYFDGDYWPGAAEDMIYQIQQEEEDRKLSKKGSIKKTSTKRAPKASDQLDFSTNASKDQHLMHKLGETISSMKEDFIMVHLQHACTHCCILMVSGSRWVCGQCKNFQLCDKCYDAEQVRDDRERHPVHLKEKHNIYRVEITDVPVDTKDKDDILESEFFDTRQAFLSLCQGNHYQYDTLRRAKHSSMMVLYHLHNPTAPAYVTTCNICITDIDPGQGWRCEACPEYDVCNSCYQKGVDHPHKLTNHPSNVEGDAQNQEARQQRVLQLRKMLDLLVHASQCRSALCLYPNCRKVKGLFRHGITCKTKASGGCGVCKKMWYLLQLHARACKESGCHVPRCSDLKIHTRRLQQQSDSRRRAAVMEMMRQRAAEVAGNS